VVHKVSTVSTTCFGLYIGHCQVVFSVSSMFIFNYALQPFEAHCAIWFRHSIIRHQASRQVSPRESTQRWKVELWARNFREFCLNADFHVTFGDLLNAVKLWHGTDSVYFPSEGRCAEDFFALKIWRLRSGANPRTWVPKASTLPLDHRSRLTYQVTI